MKLGIYPGSFNPYHAGHADVLNKALEVFDHVWVLQMFNPEKDREESASYSYIEKHIDPRAYYSATSSTLIAAISQPFHIEGINILATGIIRGLRNGHDLQYEMNQQYWNEDLGIKIPFVYFITDRKLSHVSSSGIRTVEKLGLKHNY